MLSGRRLDLLAPDPADIDIADIAHGLARVARWNGQTLGDFAFSVAQHCCIVVDIVDALGPQCPAAARLAALLHDAPEYVIGDLISPFKAAIGLDYKAFERRLLATIHRRFGVDAELARRARPLIKKADSIAAFYEATRLAGFSVEESLDLFGRPAAMPQMLTENLQMLRAWPANHAEAQYLQRFRTLAAID
jgi:5'-deoxynucleotidase YfbR-like HD superfamily hydrolase